MLVLSQATIAVGSRELLREASFSLGPKTIAGLIAPNGWGKTTLMKVLSGDVSCLKSGRLMADRVTPGSSEYYKKVYLSYSSDSVLYPHLRCRQHLELVRDLWNSSTDVDEVVHATGIKPFLDVPARKLSQGMARQLSLALACLLQTRYLLLDEPFNGLDQEKVTMMMLLLHKMSLQGTGILIASHRLDELNEICDEFVVFQMEGLATIRDGQSCRQVYANLYEGRRRQ